MCIAKTVLSVGLPCARRKKAASNAPDALICPGHVPLQHHGKGCKAALRQRRVAVVVRAVHVACREQASANKRPVGWRATSCTPHTCWLQGARPAAHKSGGNPGSGSGSSSTSFQTTMLTRLKPQLWQRCLLAAGKAAVLQHLCLAFLVQRLKHKLASLCRAGRAGQRAVHGSAMRCVQARALHHSSATAVATGTGVGMQVVALPCAPTLPAAAAAAQQSCPPPAHAHPLKTPPPTHPLSRP